MEGVRSRRRVVTLRDEVAFVVFYAALTVAVCGTSTWPGATGAAIFVVAAAVSVTALGAWLMAIQRFSGPPARKWRDSPLRRIVRWVSWFGFLVALISVAVPMIVPGASIRLVPWYGALLLAMVGLIGFEHVLRSMAIRALPLGPRPRPRERQYRELGPAPRDVPAETSPEIRRRQFRRSATRELALYAMTAALLCAAVAQRAADPLLLIIVVVTAAVGLDVLVRHVRRPRHVDDPGPPGGGLTGLGALGFMTVIWFAVLAFVPWLWEAQSDNLAVVGAVGTIAYTGSTLAQRVVSRAIEEVEFEAGAPDTGGRRSSLSAA